MLIFVPHLLCEYIWPYKVVAIGPQKRKKVHRLDDLVVHVQNYKRLAGSTTLAGHCIVARLFSCLLALLVVETLGIGRTGNSDAGLNTSCYERHYKLFNFEM